MTEKIDKSFPLLSLTSSPVLIKEMSPLPPPLPNKKSRLYFFIEIVA